MDTIRAGTIICNDLIIRESKQSRKKKFRKRIIHLILTFIFGVAFATIFHLIITNHQVRTTAEKVCEVFSKNEENCKNGIDNVFDMADNVVDNNINVSSGR